MKQTTIIILLSVLAACGRDEAMTASLPAVAAAPGVTVSGVSAGAYMATQFHVAYSREVDGAGLVAGGPWGCAQGDLQRALGACTSGDGIVPGELAAMARQLAADGAIDTLEALAGDRIYTFHGRRDTVVAQAVTDAAAAFYQAVTADATVEHVSNADVGHGWPTVDEGIACDAFGSPFINACGTDLAGDILAALHNDMHPPAEPATPVSTFSQKEFAATGLADEGYLFLPSQCRGDAACKVHVFFHGCGQSASQIGSVLAETAGFRRWAVSNNLIILYPQVEPSKLAPVNPLGCWDWWGYSGDNYLQKNAPQLRAVHAMLKRLQSAP